MKDPSVVYNLGQEQSFVVSVVSPPEYFHSLVFREVAIALCAGLRMLGRSCEIVALDDKCPGGDQRHWIVLGAHLLGNFTSLELPKKRTIYNLEAHGTDMWNKMLPHARSAPSVWDFSQANVFELKKIGVSATFVPLGYVPELERIPMSDKDIDVLFYGSINDRRKKLLDALRAEGLVVHYNMADYETRDLLIARSKVVLNLHFYENPGLFESARVSYLLANGACVVSETGIGQDGYDKSAVCVPYDKLVSTCTRYVKNNEMREQSTCERTKIFKSAFNQADILRGVLGTALLPATKHELNVSKPAPSVTEGICLCMIVKDEAKVIRRCLDSVNGLIDCWVIVDTGSTDGTQEIIREHMKGLPGELHERPWQNFAHNRNEAIELSVGKASHVLVIDADDVLEISKSYARTKLDKDCYQIRVTHGELEHLRPHIFRPETEYGHRYFGVVHEFIGGTITTDILEGVKMRIMGGGDRSQDPKKFYRDALLLESALRTEKDEGLRRRYTFYLAQSWRDYGELEKASVAYEKRVDLGGGYEDEIFVSLLELAKLLDRRGCSPETVMEAYLRAWEKQPHRAEPLSCLALSLRIQGRFALAACFADAARKIPKPSVGLFLDAEVYDWKALREFSIAADYVPGRRAAAIEAGERILKSNAPEFEKEQARKNIQYSKTKLKNEGR